MKKINQLISIIFILQCCYFSLFSQIEKKLEDEKLYKIINLTEVSKAIVRSNNELHLGDFTGMIEDNSLEDKLIEITTEIESTLGYEAFDIGLPSNCKNRENGVEEVLEMAESSDINANKYLLYSYFLNETQLSLSCKIVDKDNPDEGKLFTISTFLNTTIESATKKEFSFLNKTSIEIYCLNLFISYFNSDDLVIGSESLSNEKTANSENSTFVSLSGIVFTDESIESLIIWNEVDQRHNPAGGSALNVNGLIVGFVKGGNTYFAYNDGTNKTIFAGYAYIDKDRKRHYYYPPTVINKLDQTVEATIGIAFKNCPKVESCSHHDYIIEMKTYAIPDPNLMPDQNILRGSFSSYEELTEHITKIKINTLIYLTNQYPTEWQVVDKTGDLPLFDQINIIYTHENPCEDIPVSYSNFIGDYLKDFVQASPLFYFIEIDGMKMLLLYGPPPDNKMIAVKVDKDTDLTNDTKSSYYHFNAYCHRWEALIFRTAAESDLFNLIGADLTKFITDPHMQILLAQGTLCVLGVVFTGGTATAFILAADAGLSMIDGALYWQEGNKNGAALALGGAALGAAGVAFSKVSLLFRNGNNLKYVEPEAILSKLKIDPDVKAKFYEDLIYATDNAQPEGTLGSNRWAAFFAEHEDEAFKIYDEINFLNAHESLIRSADFLDDFYKSAQKINTLHEPSGSMVGKAIGHAFSKHGSHNTKQLLYDAVKGNVPIGQWLDDFAAEEFIARHLNQLSQGARDIPIPNSIKSIGRVFKNKTGEIIKPTHFRLVPSGSGVNTAYPINEEVYDLITLGTYIP